MHALFLMPLFLLFSPADTALMPLPQLFALPRATMLCIDFSLFRVCRLPPLRHYFRLRRFIRRQIS